MATTKNGSVNRIAKELDQPRQVVIAAPNFQAAIFRVRGTAPYVQNKFSEKSERQMLDAQQATKATSRKKRTPRDVDSDFRNAIHLTSDGKYGIPASAFRSAMIDACRVAGFEMTKAKMSTFVVADGIDSTDGTPLVYLIAEEPEVLKSHVRLQSGVASIAIRPMWKEWACDVRIKWDGDQFSQTDIANLLERAGMQVGVGEGRPFSKKSHGMGWGTFTLVTE